MSGKSVPGIKLGDLILSIRSGVSTGGESRQPDEGEKGILTLSSVVGGRFRPQACKAVAVTSIDRLGQHVRAGTLLVSRSNTEDLVGSCALVERDHPDLFLPDLLWEVRLRPDAPMSVKWMHSVMGASVMRRAIARIASGTSGSMKKISMARFRSLVVPCPPLAIQAQGLVAIELLDAASSAVERLVEAKRRLKRALLQQLMRGKHGGGTTSKLYALGDLVGIRSGNTPSKAREEYWGGGFPWVSARDLKRPVLTVSTKTITELAVAESATVVPVGTIVILVRGMTLLKDVPVALAGCELAINQDVKGLVPGGEVDPYYLLCALQAKRSRLMGFVNRAGHGTGKLDTDCLLSLPMRVPPLKQQRQAAKCFAGVDEEISLLNRQLTAYRRLKRGLMQKLLTGDIRMPSDGDEHAIGIANNA